MLWLLVVLAVLLGIGIQSVWEWLQNANNRNKIIRFMKIKKK